MKKINDSNKDVLEALYVFDWLNCNNSRPSQS